MAGRTTGAGEQWKPPPGFQDQYGVVRWPRVLGGAGEPSAGAGSANDKYVLLVRHGQSCSNVGAQPEGRVDPLLTTLGTLQARELKGRLEASYGAETLGVDRVLVSPMARALQTGAVIFSETVHAGRLELEPCLRERWVGMPENIPRGHADTAELAKTYEEGLGVRFVGMDRLLASGRDAEDFWNPEAEEKRLRAGGMSREEEERVEEHMDKELVRLLREAPAGQRIALVCHFGCILSLSGVASDNCEGLWVCMSFTPGVEAFSIERLQHGPGPSSAGWASRRASPPPPGRPPFTGPKVDQAEVRSALCAGLRAAWGARGVRRLAADLFGRERLEEGGGGGVDAALGQGEPEPPGVLLDLDFVSAVPMLRNDTVVIPLQATTLARLGDFPHVVVGKASARNRPALAQRMAAAWAPPPASRRIGTLSLTDLGDGLGFAVRGELARMTRAFAANLVSCGALKPAEDGELRLAWAPAQGPSSDPRHQDGLVPVGF